MPTTGPVSAPKTPGTKATPPDLLSGYGATRAAWATGHQLDPSGTGFWPRLADGDDTYTSVSFVRGRALSYTEHLYPAISEAEALKVVNDEMPPDVKVIGTKVSPALRPSCEQLVLSSPTIRTLAGANVLVELYSDGQGYEPQQVTRLTYQPIGQVSSALPSC
ncbi:MAG: hypothetical protein ACRDWV_11210 [Acidimicrobiales bacterium]